LGQIDEDDNDEHVSPIKSRRSGQFSRRIVGDMDSVSARSEEHVSPKKGAINLDSSLSSGDLKLKPFLVEKTPKFER